MSTLVPYAGGIACGWYLGAHLGWSASAILATAAFMIVSGVLARAVEVDL